MAYNGWKLIDKINIAVKQSSRPGEFTGYIVDANDKEALKKAKSWATVREYDFEKRQYKGTLEPGVYEFENKGFVASILDSAGGSSQGGRLSFWQCQIEKDDLKFVIGVNDAILADLIKNSDISNGVIKQEVMFARQAGKPGLIHEGMQAYKDAVADMQQKADLKSAKKTNKWEVGGVYSTLTQTDICLGEVWDTMEQYEVNESSYNYWGGKRTVTKLRKSSKPTKTIAWMHFYNWNNDKILQSSLTEFLEEQLKDREYIYVSTGKPPARSKSVQYEVKDSDLKLIDKALSLNKEYGRYGDPDIKGRYVRELK